MQNDSNTEVSIIIPVFTGHENLKYLLPAINQQALPPREIIIVDSCSHTAVKELIDNIHLDIPVHYHREDKRAFPGKARNIGVSIAKYAYIAFLDCRTIPSENWLRHYSRIMKENNTGMVAGSTTTLANNKFQWYLRTATYGTRSFNSVPGTLMEKQLFESTGGFVENLRMAEDLEWFKRLHSKQIEFVPVKTPFLKYDGLPESLFAACLKYLESGYYASVVMESYRNLVTSALLIAAILIIPKWNFLLDGWESNPLFIPNVTKILFLIVISLLLVWRFIYFLTPKEFPDNIFVLSAKLSVLGIVTVSVYNWNASIALWVEDAVLYIPHITKIYFGLLLGSVFIYRGLIKPMRNNTPRKELLPRKWFVVGILGLSMDIVKIPGTIYGSLIGRVKQLISSSNTPVGK
jgi:glycosyltransferase involved in cell wall biosynthesis